MSDQVRNWLVKFRKESEIKTQKLEAEIAKMPPLKTKFQLEEEILEGLVICKITPEIKVSLKKGESVQNDSIKQSSRYEKRPRGKRKKRRNTSRRSKGVSKRKSNSKKGNG